MLMGDYTFQNSNFLMLRQTNILIIVSLVLLTLCHLLSTLLLLKEGDQGKSFRIINFEVVVD